MEILTWIFIHSVPLVKKKIIFYWEDMAHFHVYLLPRKDYRQFFFTEIQMQAMCL